MRSGDVRAALAKKFPAPEYALFFEVGDATGGRARRWADAVAMGLWPSRGLALQGFEVKVSRQDWLNELKRPAKAEAIAQYMRNWWLVTPPGIVKEGELPEQWGHYEVHANGLRIAKQAPINLHEKTISPEFLAALLRRSDEHARGLVKDAIDKALVDERAQISNRVNTEVEWKTRTLRERAESAERQMREIEKACGLAEGEAAGLFYSDDFARACGIVHKLGIAKSYVGLRDIASKLRPMADAVDAMLADLPSDDRLLQLPDRKSKSSSQRVNS